MGRSSTAERVLLGKPSDGQPFQKCCFCRDVTEDHLSAAELCSDAEQFSCIMGLSQIMKILSRFAYVFLSFVANVFLGVKTGVYLLVITCLMTSSYLMTSLLAFSRNHGLLYELSLPPRCGRCSMSSKSYNAMMT